MTEPIVIEKIIDYKHLLDYGDIVEVSADQKNATKCYIVKNYPNLKCVNIATLIKDATGEFNKYNPVIFYIARHKTNIERIWGSFENIRNVGLCAEQAIYFKVEGHFALSPTAAGQIERMVNYKEWTVNRIIGSIKPDVFTGSMNKDHFYGGLGNDTYICKDFDWGHDTINDIHGDNKIIFKDTDAPSSFMVKQDHERLVIKRQGFGNSIQILDFFKDDNQTKFSFEYQSAGTKQKYMLSTQEDGAYKLSLAN